MATTNIVGRNDATGGNQTIRSTGSALWVSERSNLQPHTLMTSSATATASSGTLFTSNDVSMYNYHAVELATLGATSITVQGSIDGTNYSAIRMYDATTGALYAATAITDASRVYFTREKYRNIRVIITGSGSTTVRYVHGWV